MGAPKYEQHASPPQNPIIRMLKDSIMFKDMDDQSLMSFTTKFKKVELKKGEPVFLENEMAHHVFFVLDGSVELVSYKLHLRELKRIKVFEHGDHFSEFSVLTQCNHTTSCFALEDTTLMSLDQKAFHEILCATPVLAENIVRTLAYLNRQLTFSHNYIEYYKPHMLKLSQDFLELIPFDWISEHGVIPLNFSKGTLFVAVKDPYNQKFYREFRNLHNHIHLKSYVIRDTDFRTLQMQMSRYYAGMEVGQLSRTMQQQSDAEEDSVSELLEYTTIFSQLHPNVIRQIVPYFQEHVFKKEGIIFQPGTHSNQFYVIAKGSVDLIKQLDDGNTTKLATLYSRDSLSEISLVTESQNSLYAKAHAGTKIYALDKAIFAQLLKSPSFSINLAIILAKRLQELNRQMQIRFYGGKPVNESLLAKELIPKEEMLRHKVVPLHLADESELTLGIVNPEDEMLYVVITKYLKGYRINMVVLKEPEYNQVLASLGAAANEKAELQVASPSEVHDNIIEAAQDETPGQQDGPLFDPNEEVTITSPDLMKKFHEADEVTAQTTMPDMHVATAPSPQVKPEVEEATLPDLQPAAVAEPATQPDLKVGPVLEIEKPTPHQHQPQPKPAPTQAAAQPAPSMVEQVQAHFKEDSTPVPKQTEPVIEKTPEPKVEQKSKENIRPVQFLEAIIKKGYLSRTSDIHFEPHKKNMGIRYRIDGDLRELHDRIPKDFGDQVIQHLKEVSQLKVEKNDIPQFTTLEIKIGTQNYKLSVSIAPTPFGENAVLNLIHSKNTLIPLNMLAPDRETIKFLRNTIRHRQGVFLVSGAHDSGKSMTAYSIIDDLANDKRKVISIESPIEMILEDVTQIEHHKNSETPLIETLQHAVHQSPDVLYLGNIDSSKTAQFAFEMASRGHFVVATIQSNNSLDVVPRLKEWGVSSTLLANGLVGVIAQRLLPAICLECNYKRLPNPHEVEILKNYAINGKPPKEILDTEGCKKCNESGTYDRIPVFEFWRRTPIIKEAIMREEGQALLERAIIGHPQFNSLYSFGMKMVLSGLTKVETVHNNLYGLDTPKLAKKV